MQKSGIEEKIKELISFQITIQNEFLKKWPNISNWKLYLDVPKNGNISTSNGDFWHFRKHGVGIEFVNQSGVIVDFTTHFKEYPDAIDAFRLALFLESSGVNLSNDSDPEDQCSLILKEMSELNFMQTIPGFDYLYRMNN